MKNLKLNILVLSLIVISCFSCRKNFFLDPGIAPSNFTATIPFDLRDGIIVVAVEIRGQYYDFILDSGGLNLVAKEVAQELGLKGKFSKSFEGSQDGKTKMEFLTLENIRIADVDFRESNIGIMDFSSINNTGCYNFQGMIGPSLMQNAIWEIDYEKQLIKITSKENASDILFSAKKINFKTNKLTQPYLYMQIAGVEEKVKIDLGSSNGIAIKRAEKDLDRLASNRAILETASGYGSYSRALSGYGKPLTTQFARTNQVAIGDSQLSDQIITFKTSGSSTIGNDFFKDYRVIMNWFDKEMILIPNTASSISNIQNFGFKPIFKDGQASVGFIYKNSSADKVGLKITDQIISINDLSYTTKEDWCIVKENLMQNRDKELSITVLRDGKVLEFQLEKRTLL